MAGRRSISKNLLWQASTVSVATFATFIYGLLVARYLGPVDFGRFSFIVGVTGWTIGLAQGGGGNALIVLSAKHREKAGDLFWPGLAVQLGMGVVAVLIGLPIIWLFGHDASLLMPGVIYGLSNIVYLLTGVIVAIFFGLDRMAWGSCNALAAVGMASLVVVVMSLDLGFLATVSASAISQLLVLAVAFPLAWKKLAPGGWRRESASEVWSASSALWGVMLPLSLHWRIGVLAVQAFAGAHELGIYSAAAKLVENLRIFPVYFMLTFVPTFVQLGHSQKDKFRDLLQPAIRYVTMIAFLGNVLLAALAPFIIHLLYTPEYEPSAKVLRISALGLAPLFVDWAFMYVLMSLRMERQLVIIYVVSIVVEILLDAFLIPLNGAQGAAVGFVSGETTAAIMGGYFTMKAIGTISWGAHLKIASVALLSIIIMTISPAGIDPFIWAVIGCVLYLVGLFGSRAITFSELKGLLRLSAAQ